VAAENEYVGKFLVIRKLGEGGMGAVYLAQDQRVKPPRMVAIKMLRDNNPELRERFAREVGIIANFEHPNIVHVFEVDEHEGHPFMAMAYVKGETLLELIRRKAPLPLVRKLQIIEYLCAGLAYAHRQGVVHRDIKPGNVMVDSEDMVKVLDFGIAKLADSTLTISGSLIGTPNYMSPEQIMGEGIGPQSDIFAVGCLAYEILTYQQAFPGKIPEVLGRIQYQEPAPLSDTAAELDGPLAEIIERALKKNPADRYQDLADMQRDIARVRKRLEEQDDKTIVETRRRPAVEPLLLEAREALNAGDFLTARARAAEILQVDTRNTEALDIDRTAHAALLDRQSRDWLDTVREMISADNLTGADDLLQQVIRQSPNLPDAKRLRAEIALRRQRFEEDLAQQRAVARAIARARTQIAEGAFEAALRTLDEVFLLAPGHADALQLAEQARAGADGRSETAPDALARQQSAADARQKAIADCIEAGVKAASAGRLEEAAKELDEIRRLDSQSPAASRLARKIETERQALALRHRLETIRLDVHQALLARNPDLADRLTRELAQNGAEQGEIEVLKTRIMNARHDATIQMAPPTPRPVATPAPTTERRTLTEADKIARAGLRAFYQGEYAKALDVLERIPKTAVSSLARERLVFYLACSHAAIALLEGDKGRPRLEKARKLFQLSQPEKNPFTMDRRYISPEILGALAQKV